MTIIEDITITVEVDPDGTVRHVARFADGDWMATYVEGSRPDPLRSGAGWDSVEAFHRWIAWARR